MIQSILSWRTSLVALFMLVLPILVGFRVITRELAEGGLVFLAGIGFLSAKDAEVAKDKIKPPIGIWLLLLIPLSSCSCSTLKQVDYNQVAKSFSQKAIRQIFDTPNFSFNRDSIELKKVVSYKNITKVLGEKLSSKFASQGETTLSTLTVFISINWQYNKDGTTLLTFKTILKYGKTVSLGRDFRRDFRRDRLRHYDRICRQDLVQQRKKQRGTGNIG